MHFSLFSILGESNQILDYINTCINFIGLIFVPYVIWAISSINTGIEKERKEQIQKLNYLTIYSNNFLKECLNMRNIIHIKKHSLEKFLKEPNIENSKYAFSIIEVPTMMYEIDVQDYIFTADNYPQLTYTIFKINLKIKDLIHFINRLNQYSSIANTQEMEGKINIAQALLLQMDSFQYKSNIIVYCLNKIGIDIEIFNHNYFFQHLIAIDNKDVVKELVDTAEKEIDGINVANPNWRDEFIKPSSIPEIQLNLKGKLKFFYLKWKNSIHEKKRKVNAEIIRLFNKKKIESQTVNPAYSSEFAKKCNDNYVKFQELFNICANKYIELELNKDFSYIIKDCFFKQLQKVVFAIHNIYLVFPPDRKFLLSIDEINNIEILTDYTLSNYLYCLNSFSYFIAKFYNLGIEEKNINYNNEQIKKYFSDSFNQWTNSMPFEFLVEYVTCMNSDNRFCLGHFGIDNRGTTVSATICPPPYIQEQGLKPIPMHPLLNDIMQQLLTLCNEMYENIMIENSIKNEV